MTSDGKPDLKVVQSSVDKVEGTGLHQGNGRGVEVRRLSLVEEAAKRQR